MLFLVYQGLFRVFPDVVGDNNSDSVGEILMGIGERGISNKLFEFVESGSKLIGLGSSGLGSNIIVSFIRGLGGVILYALLRVHAAGCMHTCVQFVYIVRL